MKFLLINISFHFFFQNTCQNTWLRRKETFAWIYSKDISKVSLCVFRNQVSVYMEMSARLNDSGAQRGSSLNANISGTQHEMAPDLRAVKLTLYVVIFLVSAVGNSLVCTVILRRKKMKTVTNYFILNLAIADLTFTCICIPFDIPVQEMGYQWPYGALLCKVIYPLQTLSLFASIFTLTAVSLSRFWAINHPLRPQLTIRCAKWIILGIWIASLISVTPYMSVLIKDDESGRCDEDWPSKSARKTYTVCLFVFEYLLPLTIIAGAYMSIGWELARRAKHGNPHLQDLHTVEAKKVVRMLMVVTMLFAVCVLPNNILWLWLDFGNAEKQYDKFWELVAFGNIITFANSAANPICYTILNESYRDAFKDHLSKLFYKISGEPSQMRKKFRGMKDRESLATPKGRSATMNSIVW